mgnify:CR=1 FL=1
MPLPLSDYASLIEPTWLAIIFSGTALSPLPLGEGQGEGGGGGGGGSGLAQYAALGHPSCAARLFHPPND